MEEQIMEVHGAVATEFLPATQVELPDSTAVLGIVVQGQPRAYLADGMSEPGNHLVHDTIQGQDFTVTYCNLRDFARVFCQNDSEPTELLMGGWANNQMQLQLIVKNQMQLILKEQRYDHTAGDIPLQEIPVERSTWGEWKTRHPDTDLYLGDQAPLPPS